MIAKIPNSFKVLTGQGSLEVYTSYDAYINDESGFDYRMNYNLMDEEAINSYVSSYGKDTVISMYASELGNIKITEGLCVSIEGVTLEGTRR